MAAGGSVYGACDELVDPWCDPCFNDGISEQAMSFCEKCVEFHCKQCFEYHRRFGGTKHHKVLQGSRMPASQADKPVKHSLCSQHKGEAKDHYCYNHFVLICGVCSVQQHKSCNVKSVQAACTSFNIATEEHKFSSDVEIFLEYLRNTDKSLQENLNNLDKETENALKEAENNRDKQIQQINKNFDDFSTKISKLRKEQKTTLESCKSSVEQLIVDIQVITKKLQKLPTVSNLDSKFFLELQTYSENILQYEDKLTSLHLSRFSLNYDFNLSTRWLSESPSKLGDVSVGTSDFRCDTQRPVIHYPFRREGESGQGASGSSTTGGPVCPGILTRLGVTRVNISGDSETCDISGLDVTVDGHLIVSDRNNKKVKLFSLDGELLSSLKLSEKPLYVAVVDRSTAAVSIQYKSILGKSEIAILDLGHRGELSERKSIRLDREACGISVYNNQLILACYDSVIMINMEGRILWSTGSFPQQLFSWAVFLTVRSGSGPDTVLVSDSDKQTITELEADTGKLVKVCDVRGRVPRGLTVDDNGNEFVCYSPPRRDNGNVFVCYLVPGEIRVWSLEFDPGAIVYCRKRQQLIVTNYSFDNCIYNYKISSDI